MPIKLRSPIVRKLPNKPSRLLSLALEDLVITERSKKYCVDMGAWHRPDVNDGDICVVCFAGVVMAQSLRIPRDEYIGQLDGRFSDSHASKFRALNEFRYGHIEAALEWLKIPLPESVPAVTYPESYSRNPEEFKRGMKYIITLLKAAKL